MGIISATPETPVSVPNGPEIEEFINLLALILSKTSEYILFCCVREFALILYNTNQYSLIQSVILQVKEWMKGQYWHWGLSVV